MRKLILSYMLFTTSFLSLIPIIRKVVICKFQCYSCYAFATWLDMQNKLFTLFLMTPDYLNLDCSPASNHLNSCCRMFQSFSNSEWNDTRHQSYHSNLIHPLISRQLKDWLQGIFEFFGVLFGLWDWRLCFFVFDESNYHWFFILGTEHY